MLLVHGVAARLLLNRTERTTAVLHLIRSLGNGPVEFALKRQNSFLFAHVIKTKEKYNLDMENKDSSSMLYCSGVVTP